MACYFSKAEFCSACTHEKALHFTMGILLVQISLSLSRDVPAAAVIYSTKQHVALSMAMMSSVIFKVEDACARDATI